MALCATKFKGCKCGLRTCGVRDEVMPLEVALQEMPQEPYERRRSRTVLCEAGGGSRAYTTLSMLPDSLTFSIGINDTTLSGTKWHSLFDGLMIAQYFNRFTSQSASIGVICGTTLFISISETIHYFLRFNSSTRLSVSMTPSF